jgi:hypothetical protein
MPAAYSPTPRRTHSRRKQRNMNGIRVFESLEEALAAGFALFDHIPGGYLVRKDTGGHFALAIVKLKTKDRDPVEK